MQCACVRVHHARGIRKSGISSGDSRRLRCVMGAAAAVGAFLARIVCLSRVLRCLFWEVGGQMTTLEAHASQGQAKCEVR